MSLHALLLPYCSSELVVAKPATSQTILLVEDDDNLRTLLRAYLTKKGYTVLDAGFNSSAFLMAGRHDGPIHLMITDLMMPGTTGHDLATRLKIWRPEMKVLYISGQSKIFIDRNGLLEPGDAFLQKPFDPQALLQTVHEILASDLISPSRPTGSKRDISGRFSLLASVKSLLHLD